MHQALFLADSSATKWQENNRDLLVFVFFHNREFEGRARTERRISKLIGQLEELTLFQRGRRLDWL